DFSYPVAASDPDGDPLSFFLINPPAGMSIDRATGAITWRPELAQLGSHSVTVSVRDSRGGAATQTFDLEVTRDFANGSPAMTPTAPLLADPGVLYRYAVTATDPENDPIAFDLPLRPAGMTIQPTTGLLTWTPTALQSGVHDVIVRARDPQGGANLQHFLLKVREPNSPPVITSVPPRQAVQDLPLEYHVQAQDSADETLTFSLPAGPAGMTMDPMTGVLRWTPNASQLGSQEVTVAVTDDRGGQAMQTFTLQVVADAVNDPPQIRSTPRTQIHLGGQYLYQVQAVDPNHDPLTYRLVTAPAGMTVDAGGLVLWDPQGTQLGANAVVIEVNDGRGGVATQSFMIEVTTSSRNREPIITSTPPAGALVGRPYAYDVLAVDPDGDPLTFQLDTAPRGMSVHPELGTVRWLPAADQVGEFDVVLRVLDAQGAAVTQSFRVAVRSVNSPPVIRSTPPTEGAVGVPFTYPVAATDPDGDRLTFTLQTAPAGMSVDADGGLIQWTPSDQQLGPQDVVVVADDGLGGTATQRFTVVVTAIPANRPPVITSTPALVATVGLAYPCRGPATDPEGQAVTFLLLESPSNMSIDLNTGDLLWSPTADQLGPVTVTVAARDTGGATAVQRFTIAVADNNRPPAITS